MSSGPATWLWSVPGSSKVSIFCIVLAVPHVPTGLGESEVTVMVRSILLRGFDRLAEYTYMWGCVGGRVAALRNETSLFHRPECGRRPMLVM